MKLFEFGFRSDNALNCGIIFIIEREFRKAVELANEKLKNENFACQVTKVDLIDDSLRVHEDVKVGVYGFIFPNNIESLKNRPRLVLSVGQEIEIGGTIYRFEKGPNGENTLQIDEEIQPKK